ncbi:MAG: hypothetical protein AAF555_11735 [Verrucomicrobiota bacterium]
MNKTKTIAARPEMTSVERGKVAALEAAKEVRAERKRWGMPLLVLRDGEIVEEQP